LLLAIIGALAWPATSSAQLPSDEMFAALNRVRAEHGLVTLRPDPLLSRSAHLHAVNLIRQDRFYHSFGFLRGHAFSVRSEMLMLHTDGGINVPKVVRGWLDSPPHRRVLLDPQWRYLGVGLAQGRWRNHAAAMWVARVAA
jgi:uncharacterized protein YkwD